MHSASAESSLMVAAGICWMGKGSRAEIANLGEAQQRAKGEGKGGGKGTTVQECREL